MKKHLLVSTLFLVLFYSVSGQEQDSIFTLIPEQISEDGYLYLPPITEWKFKKGNNPEWINPDFDDSSWIKMDSSQINTLWYDNDNKFEGWFRFQFQLKRGFIERPCFLFLNNGAATNVYLDGQLAANFGVAATSKQVYRRSRRHPEFVPLEEGHIYSVAVHFVDRVGPISQFLNKRLTVLDPGMLLYLSSKSKAKQLLDTLRDRLSKARFVGGLLVSISLLLWLIWAINRGHKHLLYLAVLSTAINLQVIPSIVEYEAYPRGGIWFNEEQFATRLVLGASSGAILGVFIPWLLATLLQGEIPKWLRLAGLFALFILAPIFVLFSSTSWTQFIPMAVILSGALIGVYYLIRYRKSIVGARWVLVVGLAIVAITSPILNYFSIYNSIFIMPLSFILYVALWLRETQLNERSNAIELARVSAENQKILEEQNRTLEIEVHKRTRELENSLASLKNTQSQLIHSEKMASLGELTAGIAHEIQNPLNFVNNFSEVNRELIEDLKEAIAKNDQEEVNILLADLLENEDKVTHHGKRAEQIVKSMLQHSRGAEGKKEPTDINALCDEYLRLSFHGFRAKDKSFNAGLELDLDPALPKVEVVPQDIGRVLLNLINNAFQAVTEVENPKVTVKTALFPPPRGGSKGEAKEGVRGVSISVSDNGPGIPEDIRDKVFQPFFTTKPTGQGTGLGLSMSYDIVTKGHGGKLEVESEEGKGTTFIVQLPLMK